jgi:hypothetical protein
MQIRAVLFVLGNNRCRCAVLPLAHFASSKGDDLSKARRAARCLFRASGTVPSTCCKSGWKSGCQLGRQAPSCLRACTTDNKRDLALCGREPNSRDTACTMPLSSFPEIPVLDTMLHALRQAGRHTLEHKQDRDARRARQAKPPWCSYPVKSVHVR